MQVFSIDTGTFKLDGGAMFGVVPKVIWNGLYPSDENNLCTWAMRCLLIVKDDRKILIDCGIGNKQNEKFLKNYYLENPVSITDALALKGHSADSITDVVLTHLHFDHCGGAVRKTNDGDNYEVAFKNAKYWVSRAQWDWAINPNRRELASFLKENFIPIEESGQLNFIDETTDIYPFIRLKMYFGHTAGQIIPQIQMGNQTLVYMGDLIPSSVHLPLPYIMSYDTSPLISLKEKEAFLNEAVDNNFILFFEHDKSVECCSLIRTEKGVRMEKSFKLEEIT